jgi:small-conductance mechanosensitive channel
VELGALARARRSPSAAVLPYPVARMPPLSWLDQALERHFGIAASVTDSALGTLAVALVYLALRRLARQLLPRFVSDASARRQANKAVGYGLGLLGFAVIVRLWARGGISGIETYFGLLSAGLAIALQGPVANVAAWIYIVLRRPFGIGDRIQIGQHIGDVVDVRPFRFLLLEIGNGVKDEQGSGRVIHVPNALVFKSSVANYDDPFGYIWNELEVVVTMESNWRAAKTMLERILDEHAEKLAPDVTTRIRLAAESMHIRFGKLTPVVWTSMVDSGVCLTMRYLCKPRERRTSASAIWESVLVELGSMPYVDLAYATQRIFDQSAHRLEVQGPPDPRRS